VIEIAMPAPAIGGLRFRHYRGEEDLPAMLRVYSAAHEADGLEEVTTLELWISGGATSIDRGVDAARRVGGVARTTHRSR
jgi:hypothetical protein